MTTVPSGPAPRRAERRLGSLDVAGPVVLPALTVVAVLLAAWPWLRAYDVAGTGSVLALGAVLPVLITFGAARVLRQPPVVSYVASLVGLMLVVAATVGVHPSALTAAAAHDPSRLLTETLPLAGPRSLLLAPLVVVWLTGAATAEMLSRSRRGALFLAVPLVSYVIAFAATAGAPPRDDASGAGLLGALALLAVVHHGAGERGRSVVAAGAGPAGRSPTGPQGVLGAGLAVVVAAGLGVGLPRVPALTGHQASVRRHPATVAAPVVDPVDVIASLRDSDPTAAPTTLLSVTTSAPATGYLGLATFDDYDGATWTFDTTFQPTGGRVPPAPAATPGAATGANRPVVTQQYRLVHSYALPLIPMLDRPTRVSGLTVDADAVTGMVVPVGPLAIPSSYAVRSEAPEVTLAGLPAADVIDQGSADAADAADAADLAVPADATAATTATLRFFASITGKAPTASLPFLQAVVAALHQADRRVNPTRKSGAGPSISGGGTSLAEVVNAVTVDREATPEQFATLLVITARDLGIPSRLVTGFRAVTAGGAVGLTAGTTEITNREAWTWAEVPVRGVGWVVVDPTPTLTAASTFQPPTAGSTTATTLAPPRANAVPGAAGSGGTRAVAKPVTLGRHGTHRAAWLPDLLFALAVLVLIVAIGPAVALGRRVERRRRRRSPDGAVLAVGAWLELLDTFDAAGLRTDPGTTSTEITTRATQRFGPEVVDGAAAVAALADRAVYCAGQPPDAAAAGAAWRAQRVIRRRLLRSLDARRRATALLAVGRQPRRPAGRSPSRPRGGTRRPVHRRRERRA